MAWPEAAADQAAPRVGRGVFTMAQLLEYERVELKERNAVFSGELGVPYRWGQIAQHVDGSDRQRQRFT